MQHLSPMAICEQIIGSPEVIANITKTASKSPYGWRGNSMNRDAGDIPSARHMRALLAYAATRGLPLTAEDLIWGAPADEIEARLARLNSTAPAPVQGAVKTGGGGACAAPASFTSSRGGHSPVTGADLQADAPRAAGMGHPAAKLEPACAEFPKVAHG